MAIAVLVHLYRVVCTEQYIASFLSYHQPSTKLGEPVYLLYKVDAL